MAMNYRYPVYILVLLALLLAVFSFADSTNSLTAKGIVFADANGNGIYDKGEKGLAHIRVSNGKEIVLTDAKGNYQLPVTGDCIIFVIKPRNYKFPLNNNNLNQFYYVYRPNGSPQYKYPGFAPTGPLPEAINFPLIPAPEKNEFKMIAIGDPQVPNIKSVDYFCHDILEEMVDSKADFMITLGDNGSNRLDAFPPLITALGRVGLPWYPTAGNHDENFDAPSDDYALETYQANFAPRYYSFDYGPVHFINLDDVMFIKGVNGKDGSYKAGLGQDQLEFIKNDLKLCPKDQLIVLYMHIPINHIADRKELFKMLESYPNVFSLSGHMHTQSTLLLGKKVGWESNYPHRHFVVGTACGSWWGGAKDEYGLPNAMMADGTPNGYAVITFKDKKYDVFYKSARKPDNFQMSLYYPDNVNTTDIGSTYFYANVFAAGNDTQVALRINGQEKWAPMEQVQEFDPWHMITRAREKGMDASFGSPVVESVVCKHLWKTALPVNLQPGTYRIDVRAENVWNKSFTDYRIIRIK